MGNRVSEHVREFKAGRSKNGAKTHRIAEILCDGFMVEEVVLDRFEVEDDAFAREAELINEIGLDKLTNIQAGGGGGRSSNGVKLMSLLVESRAQEDKWSRILDPCLDVVRIAARFGYTVTPTKSAHGEMQESLRRVAATFMLAIRAARNDLEAMKDEGRVPADLLDSLIQQHVDSLSNGIRRKETGSGASEGDEKQEDARAA